MSGRSLRWVAILVVVAMVAGACTKTDADTTTTVVRNSPEAKAMIDAALGGTQAVQDFLIHLDMLIQTDGGNVSFYEQVIARAAEGAGESVELAGGLTFAAVDSLEGAMFDSDGSQLTSLSLDFGLMGVSVTGVESLDEALDALFDETSPGASDPSLTSDTGLLVEIVTADLNLLRTHVGPGDVASLDLSFVELIEPGDLLTSSYVFGQTHPGAPSQEAGMSALELFVFRWNEGLISFAGTDSVAVAISDQDSVLSLGPPGSTANWEPHSGDLLGAAESERPVDSGLPAVRNVGFVEGGESPPASLSEEERVRRNQVIKRAIVAAAFVQGSLAAAIDEDNLETTGLAQGSVEVAPGVFALWHPERGFALAVGDPPRPVYATSSLDTFIIALGIFVRSLVCTQAANFMLRKNEELGRPQDTPSDLQDPCFPPPPLPDPPPPFPPGAIVGDVHLRTFDRLAYSNQAAGEFLLFDNGVATIQMRTEPVEGLDSVSVATALALGIGAHSISLHAGGETWIDGELSQLTRGETVAIGDGAILWWKGGWVVVWPDGSRLEITNFGPELLAFVTPSSNPSTGMLGDGDGDPANDLLSRSGELFQVPRRPSGGYDDAFYDSFYSTYVDSWRITQEESLFHYEPGQSTATFTIEGFPARYARVSDLDAQTRADAEDLCRSGSVTREDLLEDCTLDVGSTGQARFAYAHFLVESRTESAVRSPDGASPMGPEDGTSIVTIGSLTIDFGPDSPLRDPSTTSRWECSADEGQFRAFSTFAESPTRSFDITVLYGSADTNPTGDESFAVVVRLNSEDYAWTGITIDDTQPFTFDLLDFDGTTLKASGTGYLNDPPLPNAFPLVVPQGGEVTGFALHATCG
jgi:hypothetical protein